MRLIRIEMFDGDAFEYEGDVDVSESDGFLRVYDYDRRKTHGLNGEVFIAAAGRWICAWMGDEYEPEPLPTIAELGTRLAAYDASRAAFPR